MSAPGAVYKSTDEAVLAAWNDWAKARADWSDKMYRIVRSVSPYTKAKTEVQCFSDPTRFAGLSYQGDDLEALKEKGWRLDRKHWVLRPHQSTVPGRKIKKTLDEIGSFPAVELPGMPRSYWYELSLMGHGVHRHDGPPGGFLFVTWSKWLPGLDEKVDKAVWTDVALSEFYKVQEDAGRLKEVRSR